MYIAIIPMGMALYKLGNLFFGKHRRGGKRIIIFVTSTLFGICSIFCFSDGYLSLNKFTWIDGLGALFAIFSYVFLYYGYKANNEKVDKVFDDMLGGL